MMRSLALVACCAVVATPIALADGGNSNAATPTACAASSDQAVAQGKQIAAAAFRKIHWRERHPIDRAQKAILISAHACADSAGDRAIKRYAGKRKVAFHLYRAYRLVTPFTCQRGMYGHWAIPCSIIECESHFSWSAHNSSGASGPYQLLGWGAPYPARTFRAKLENHRIAYNLYAGGSGRSNWVC